MELGNIDINSVEYRGLSNLEKLINIRLKLEEIFNSQGLIKCDVSYKGNIKTIPRSKFNEYDLLCRLESELASRHNISKLADIYMRAEPEGEINLYECTNLSIEEQLMLFQKRLGIDFNLDFYNILLDSFEYRSLPNIKKLLLLNSKREFILFLKCCILNLNGSSEDMILLNQIEKRINEMHSALCDDFKTKEKLNELIAKTKLNGAERFIASVSLNFSSEPSGREEYIKYSDKTYRSLSFEEAENMSVENKIMFVLTIIENIDYVFDMINIGILSTSDTELSKKTMLCNDLKNKCISKLMELSRNLGINKINSEKNKVVK